MVVVRSRGNTTIAITQDHTKTSQQKELTKSEKLTEAHEKVTESHESPEVKKITTLFSNAESDEMRKSKKIWGALFFAVRRVTK